MLVIWRHLLSKCSLDPLQFMLWFSFPKSTMCYRNQLPAMSDKMSIWVEYSHLQQKNDVSPLTQNCIQSTYSAKTNKNQLEIISVGLIVTQAVLSEDWHSWPCDNININSVKGSSSLHGQPIYQIWKHCAKVGNTIGKT